VRTAASTSLEVVRDGRREPVRKLLVLLILECGVRQLLYRCAAAASSSRSRCQQSKAKMAGPALTRAMNCRGWPFCSKAEPQVCPSTH
jgi:hypothetical protein